jgi:hypothetical protein
MDPLTPQCGCAIGTGGRTTGTHSLGTTPVVSRGLHRESDAV